MKTKFLYITFFTVLTGLITSCSKSSFLDVNKTPNNPTSVPPKVLMANSIYGVAFSNGNELGRVASVLMQHNAGVANQAAGFDIYNLDGSFDNAWDFEIYSNAVSDLRDLIAKTESTSPVYSGIAKILLAYQFSLATDLWGDIPYSQAGLGLQFPTPRFDKQEDIYQGNSSLGIQGLFDLVKSGIADLDKTSILRPAADDAVYSGNTANWKRAANSLLLKLAMQISNTNATLSKAVIQDVIAGNNYISTNLQDMEVPFGTQVGSQSPIYSFNNVNRPTDHMLSSRFLALMVAQNDTTRLSFLYTKPTGAFIGYDNGNTVPVPPQATRSRYNVFVTGSADGTTRSFIRLISNSQTQFILAEAALIYGTAGDANALYQSGIKANMSKMGMSTAQIDKYFTENPAVVTLSGTTEEKRKQIIIQKYISFVPNPIEAYNDYRRTGYPNLNVALNSAGDDPTIIPKRYPYTPNERARNANCPNPRPLMSEKVWWGK